MQHGFQEPVPPALQGAPREVLEGYVASRLRQHVMARGQALGLPEATVQALLEEAPQAAVAPPPATAPAQPAPASSSGSGGEGTVAAKTLIFFHECQRLGCADPACQLCANNPQRKCGADFFLHKVFQGAPLTAVCGAPLRVAVCSTADGVPARQGELPAGLQLEAFLLNNRLYEQESADPEADRLAAAQLLKNAKGSHLLLCAPGGPGEQLPSGVVRTPLGGATMELPELRIDGSSEGLLGSKLWGYRLAVRVVDAAGAPVRGVAAALSPQFIVTTTRVKGNVKPAVPLTTDPVGKLNGIGERMATKLAQAEETLAGVGVEVPPGGITTVGDFRSFVLSLEGQPKAVERVVAALGLQKGWAESRHHALSAVQPDFLLRVWWADPQLTSGLVFKANLGTPLLDQPVGVASGAPGGGLTVSSQETAVLQPGVQLWRQQARACWVLPGHPGWGLLGLHGDALDAALAAGRGQALLPAELAQQCRQEVAARLATMPPPETLMPQALAALSGLPPEVTEAAAAAAAAPGSASAAPRQRAALPAALAAEPAGPAAAGQDGMWLQAPGAGAGGDGQMGEPRDQEPLNSPYETAMRLPSLPLLGREPFGSLPKEVQAMESLSGLLFGNQGFGDSLLPALGQLAERKAAEGGPSGPGGPGGSGNAEPSLLMQLLMSLDQHNVEELGLPPHAATAAAAAAEAAAAGSPFEPGALPEQPSWIPAGLFAVKEDYEGEAMAVSRSTSRDQGGAKSPGQATGRAGAQRPRQGGSWGEAGYEQLLASMSLDR